MKTALAFSSIVVLSIFATLTQAIPRGIKHYTEPITAPNFNLQDLHGVTHQLTDYQGKVVIVNFWAVWCRPCIKEMPSLQNASNQLQKHDVHVIAINIGDQADKIRTFLKDRSLSILILLDQQSKVTASWEVLAMPTTYIVDPTGKIVMRVVGEYDWNDPDLLDQIRSISVKHRKQF